MSAPTTSWASGVRIALLVGLVAAAAALWTELGSPSESGHNSELDGSADPSDAPEIESHDAHEQLSEANNVVYAISYGHTPDFDYSFVLPELGSEARGPLEWLVFLIRRGEEFVLVDTGFDDPETARHHGFSRHAPVAERLREMNVEPAQVTKIILTHLHWDHAGGVVHFPNAEIFVQRAEWEYSSQIVSRANPQNGGVNFTDILTIQGAGEARRVHLLDGSAEIMAGVFAHPGGGHTPGTQWVEVRTARGTTVLAGDTAFLYEHLSSRSPTGATSSPTTDVELMDHFFELADRRSSVIPGHDPLVLTRFPHHSENTVRIE